MRKVGDNEHTDKRTVAQEHPEEEGIEKKKEASAGGANGAITLTRDEDSLLFQEGARLSFAEGYNVQIDIQGKLFKLVSENEQLFWLGVWCVSSPGYYCTPLTCLLLLLLFASLPDPGSTTRSSSDSKHW